MATALRVTSHSPPAAVIIDAENLASVLSNTDVTVSKELPVPSHAPYMSIAVPACKRGSSCTIAQSPKNCGLNIATSSTTAAVKKENALDVSKVEKVASVTRDGVRPEIIAVSTIDGVLRLHENFSKSTRDARAPSQ